MVDSNSFIYGQFIVYLHTYVFYPGSERAPCLNSDHEINVKSGKKRLSFPFLPVSMVANGVHGGLTIIMELLIPEIYTRGRG